MAHYGMVSVPLTAFTLVYCFCRFPNKLPPRPFTPETERPAQKLACGVLQETSMDNG